MAEVNSTLSSLVIAPQKTIYAFVDHSVNSMSNIRVEHFVPTASTLSSLVLFFRNHLTWTTLFWLLASFSICANLKSMPFFYHLRIINAFRFCMRSQRSKVPVTPAHLFQPLITTSRAPLMEIDFLLHKSNSSYFCDVDIARVHLFCTLLSLGMEKIRGSTSAIRAKGPAFGIALGGVSCYFKKELKPYEKYEMFTRIVSWDEKWFYVVTHFVRKDTQNPENFSLYPQQRRRSSVSLDGSSFDSKKGIYGTALSRCVCKVGRKTISPEHMLRTSGLLPEGGATPNVIVSTDPSEASYWTAERIEEERLRGLEIVKQLSPSSQEQVEAEFNGDSTALGSHTDGAGIVGVVSTLAQLAHLKKDQIL